MNKLGSKHRQSHHNVISLDKLEIWTASQDHVTLRPLATRAAPHWDDTDRQPPRLSRAAKSQSPLSDQSLCKSHGERISLAIQILTSLPSSYLDLDFLSSPYPIFYLIKHSFRFFTLQNSTLHSCIQSVAGRPYRSLSTFQGPLPHTANMQFTVLALVSLVAVAFASPVAMPARLDGMSLSS